MSRRRHVSCFLAMLGALFAGSHGVADSSNSQPPTTADVTDVQELAHFMDATVEAYLRSKHVPGATVSVVKDGKKIFSKGYGFADVEKGIPVDPARSLFRIGSISKLFTATAALQLVEQGKLTLDDDVIRLLPDVPIEKKFPDPISLRHLFTHTAGFEDAVFGRTTTTYTETKPLEDILREYFPAQVRKPGTASAYSNHGTALIGRLVEVASGQDYHDYVRDHILKPLGMTRTTTLQPLPDALLPDYAWGYSAGNSPFRKQPFLTVPIAPAGSVSSTADDMARFMIAHLQMGAYGDTRILREDTAAMMQSRQFSADARVSGMALQFYENFINGERIVAHAGGIDFHESNMILLPQRQLGLFVSFNGPGSEMFAFTQQFMDHYFPPPAPRAATQDSSTRIPLIVGEYVSNRRGVTNSAKAVLVLRGAAGAVSDLGDGVIAFRKSRWIETEPFVFDEIDGQDRLVFKVNPAANSTLLIAAKSPYETLERLTAWQRPHVQILIGKLAIAGVFLGLLWWAYSEALTVLGETSLATRERNSLRLFAAAAGIAAFTFIQLQTDFGRIAQDYPAEFQFALNLNYLLYPLVLAIAVMALLLWRRPLGAGLWFRVRYGLLALVSIIGLAWLHHWQLIGA